MLSPYFVAVILAVMTCAQSWVFDQPDTKDFQKWLKKYNLLGRGNEVVREGCTSVITCVDLWDISDGTEFPRSGLPDGTALALQRAAKETKQELLFLQWLNRHGLLQLKDMFISLGVKKFDDLRKIQEVSEIPLKGFVTDKQYDTLALALSTLPSSKDGYKELASALWEDILAEEAKSWTTAGVVLLSLIVVVFTGMVVSMYPNASCHDSSRVSKLSFLSLLTGKYLSPKNCKVVFEWTEPQAVGSTLQFIVEFYQRNGQPYPICDADNLLIEVTQGNNKIACSTEFGGTDPDDVNKAKVQFTIRRAGEYHISVLVGMVHIKGSPFVKKFIPGPPDPLKTGFIHHSSTVVGSENIPSQLFIEPRDRFGNLCDIEKSFNTCDDYNVDIIDVATGKPVADSSTNAAELQVKSTPDYIKKPPLAAFVWQDFPVISRRALMLTFSKKGCYRVTVTYKGQSLQNGDFHAIVLSELEALSVQKHVAKRSTYYGCKLRSLNNKLFPNPKDVECHISPKQLTVREKYWVVFRRNIADFRVCPSTRFRFERQHDWNEPILVIEDGCQSQVELMSTDSNVIAAVFTQFLLKNIGGSETFRDKQDFFHHEVRKFHQKHFHEKLQLKINRKDILQSSMSATKNFKVSDWCKNFEIHFADEEGLDWGGLRREWFDLICSSLFDPQNGLFRSFKSDGQGLVHPVPFHLRPAKFKSLKYFEFAGRIVGKCLYESSLGSSYRQLVKAKFSRSFLAQLIGLSVHYKYFEHDDPELYVSKIKYILENNVDNMGLTFTDEVYSSKGELIQVYELIEGGAKIEVNRSNKQQYLDALAKYRLAHSIKDEVQTFLNGLKELIPENYLCIFDENELELLMCGTGNYSIADFKANHSVSGSSYEFRKVLDWFWTAVSNFTEEEMARLLQFTTGCSQLPPGGFSELNPKFHITSVPTFGNLPTAHTCFNQLCLPEYDSYEQFERALRLAINEGSEGFGMI